ncbi:MAG: hypothetical protein QXF23_03375 [Candidatus Bathyarchaeia archaeon]|nr:DUF5615 family PIN-like protein [Candidatus Bathyarchaeota archaeon]
MQKPKLLLDKNIGLKVYKEVIKIARREGKIIVTMDKEFGYMCSPHKPPGIVLL